MGLIGVTRALRWGVKIRSRKYASGETAWQLDLGSVAGRRVQRSFATRAAALEALRDAKEARRVSGEGAIALTAAEAAEARRCMVAVAGVGATLGEAVEYFLNHGGRVTLRGAVPVEVMVEAFIDARWAGGCSVRYRHHLRTFLRSLARFYAGRAVDTLTRADLELWLGSQGWAGKTRNNALGDARALFAWGKVEGYLRGDPCSGVAVSRVTRAEVGTLTFEQCARLLLEAVEKPKFCGYVVLGLFGGIRPAEIKRLQWSAVDLEAGTVIVAAELAKTRARRVVDLSVNARAWLRACYGERLPVGKICNTRFDDDWVEWRKKVISIQDWPGNAMRHTFASMHYAEHQDEAALQVQMGHESAVLIHRAYRAIKTRAEAARFWRLVPGAVE